MKMKIRKSSIYFQLFKLLLFAAVISTLLFFILNFTFSYLTEEFLYTKSYEEELTNKYIQSLQQYIFDHQIDSKHCSKLQQWVKKQGVISISIFQGQKLLFNSSYPDWDYWEEDIETIMYSWANYYDIELTDTSASVELIGTYEYQMYYYFLIIEILISFTCFICLILFGIRKKIIYIRQLSREILVLESGSLGYKITERGNDELSVLANSLEKMRISIVNMIERENELLKTNQSTIREMSHDLRTPITAILLFMEILKKEGYNNRQHLEIYMSKMEKKILMMKNLTESLFRYSLNKTPDISPTEKTIPFDNAFYDPLSELCTYLKHNIFKLKLEIVPLKDLIRIKTEYIPRIMENLTSNFIKYADPDYEIEITTVIMEEYLGLSFCNTIYASSSKTDHHGIGLTSVKKMIEETDGKMIVKQDDRLFSITLLFKKIL